LRLRLLGLVSRLSFSGWLVSILPMTSLQLSINQNTDRFELVCLSGTVTWPFCGFAYRTWRATGRLAWWDVGH